MAAGARPPRTFRLLPAALSLLLRPQAAGAMCPKGFGSADFFPKEWGIPAWPQDMAAEEAGRLRTVTLTGFAQESLNEEYLEGPTEEFEMQGRETYWQASGEHFLYWCMRFQKWRIAGIDAFGQNKNGNCFGFASDAHPGRDIRSEDLLRGWIEVDNGEWVLRKEAGVARLGTLADQMAGAGNDERGDSGEADECQEGEAEEGGEAPLFGGQPKQRSSKCPLRRAGAKLKEGLVAAGKWIRRLFPALLGAPPEDGQGEAAREAGEL